MRRNKKGEFTHGFLSNLKFMIYEQWNFDKKAVTVPFVRVLSDLAVSFMSIWFPKVVLDAIMTSVPANLFLIRIGTLTIVWMILKYTSYYTEQSIYKNSAKIWNLHFYIKKDRKILDMDYSIFSSPEGKIKIQKAHQALNRNIHVNMVSFYSNLTELMKSILGLISYSTVIAILNPIIVIVLFTSYGIDSFVTMQVQKWEHSLKNTRAQIDRKLEYINESTNDSNMAKDIRIYSMKEWISSVTQFIMNDKLTLEKKVETKHLKQRLFEALLIFLRNGGAYIYLIWRMLSTDMSIGDFTLYFGAISGFGQWLEQIVGSIDKLSNANFKVDDYRYLVDTKDKMKREEGTKLPPKKEPVEIILENVSFHYEGSDRPILDNINLKIEKGERLAVVGANGAGKTTLIKLICGLLEPVSGRILLNGTNVKEYNRDEYYTFITAVFQNACIMPMSISRNITFCPDQDMDRDKLEKCIELADLKDKIKNLPDGFNTNLVPAVSKDGVNLSGGEMQKLMLARALYKDAPLIILDEPTAALDPIAENQMYLRYDDLTKNKTAVYISHRLSSTRFCDRIIYLDNGKIIESGSHDELMAYGGEYKKIFDIQSRYYKNNIREEAV